MNLGNYFLVALSGQAAREQDAHFALELLADRGVYDAETDLYWAKIPGYIPETDSTRSWHPCGGQGLIDHCATMMFCVDGSVLALLKGDAIPPMAIHQKAPLLVMFRQELLHVV